MLRSFSSTPAKSYIALLLWAHTLGATIARRIVVDDAETDKILYSTGWTESYSCPECPADSNRTQGYINHGTWHRVEKISDLGNVDFKFTFNGTSVEVRFIATCPGSNFTRASYTIDEASRMAEYVHNCSGSEYSYNQTLLSVSGLSNQQHTLRIEPLTTNFRLDYLVYEVEGYNGMETRTNIADVTGTATNLLTSFNPTSSSFEVAQEGSAPSPSPDVSLSNSGGTSSPNLGAIIGGAGAVLLVLGVALFLFLKRRRGTRPSEAFVPYTDSNPFGVGAPELRSITRHPENYPLNIANTVANQVQPPLPDQPVEAGLMSRSQFPGFPSDGSSSPWTLYSAVTVERA